MLKDFKDLEFSNNTTLPNGSCQPVFCTEEQLSLFIESLRPREQLGFNVILRMGNQYPVIKPKQGTIAHFAGYARETVNRKIQEWVKMGVFSKKYIYNQACEYTLHPLFFEFSFRKKYSHIFSAFKTCALIYLFSFGKAHVFDNVTLISPVIKILNPRYGNSLSNVNRLTDSKRESRSIKNMYASEARKKVLIEITNRVGLTRRGQAALAPYPAECLEYSLDKLKFANVHNIRNIWPWFISLCNEWCKSNEIRPDFKAENDIISEYKLQQDGPKINPDFKMQTPEVSKRTAGGSRQWESKSSYSSNKLTGKATNYASVNFSFPPMTREEYNDTELSKKYHLALKEHNKQRNIASAQENGDQKEIEAQKIYDKPITKEDTPGQYRFVTDLYRSIPDKTKQEWLDNLQMVPDVVAQPLRQVLQDFKDGIVISSTPNILTELSKKLSVREQLPKLIDYSEVQEELDVGFL